MPSMLSILISFASKEHYTIHCLYRVTQKNITTYQISVYQNQQDLTNTVSWYEAVEKM